MSHGGALRRLANVLSLFALAASLVVALPVASLPGHSVKEVAQAAAASVAQGDYVYDWNGGVHLVHKGVDTTLKTDGWQAEISPNSRKIVYVTNRNSYNPSLWVMDSDGSNDTQASANTWQSGLSDYNPRWSPDGKWIAFVRCNGTSCEVRKIRASATSDTSITLTKGDGLVSRFVSWSPADSRGNFRLAFDRVDPNALSGQTQIWIMDAADRNSDGYGDNLHRITTSVGSYSDVEPAWSAQPYGTTGQRIYFNSNQDNGIRYISDSNNFASALSSPPRSALTQESGGAVDEIPRVAGDGNWVFFDSTGHSAGGLPKVFRVKARGSYPADLNLKALTSSWGQSASPVLATTGNAPAPSWWKGTKCDTINHPGSDQLPLGNPDVDTAAYRGVMACGPGFNQHGVRVETTFGNAGGATELEWECVELVKRYMYLMYGVLPYSANGYQVAENYSGGAMQVVNDASTTTPPAVGDILQIDREAPFDRVSGHTGIVTSNTGGKITFLEQNDGGDLDGYHDVAFSGGDVDHVTKWLHYRGS